MTHSHLYSAGHSKMHNHCLPVSLSNALNILLLDRIAVGGSLGGIDDLLSQAFCDRLDVAECCFASTSGEQENRLVDTTQRRNVDSLATNHTSRTDAARVL